MSKPSIKRILNTLESEKLPAQDELIGKEIAAFSDNRKAIIALDSEMNIHLLLPPSTSELSNQLSGISLRKLFVEINSWKLADVKEKEYLDIFCEADLNSDLRTPFVSFCEDILFHCNDSPVIDEVIYQTYVRWRSFWSLLKQNKVKKTWVYGLFGELSILKMLIEKKGNQVVSSWTGPDGGIHDFLFDNSSVEVKTASNESRVVDIHGTSQLELQDGRRLFLSVCILGNNEDNLTNLPALVSEIENMLDSTESLDVFSIRLAETGYRRENEAVYREFNLSFERADWFIVDEHFPKMTSEIIPESSKDKILSVKYKIDLTNEHAESNQSVSKIIKDL